MKKIGIIASAVLLVVLAIPLQYSTQASLPNLPRDVAGVKKPHFYGVRNMVQELKGTETESSEAFPSATASTQSVSQDGTIIFNKDPSLFEQNEETVAVNPLNNMVVLGGANDYRFRRTSPFRGVGTGFYVTTDGGASVATDGVLFPINPVFPSSKFDGAGDPVAEFGPDGTAYMGGLGFYAFLQLTPIPEGHQNDNGVFVFTSSAPYTTWTQHTVFFSPDTGDSRFNREWDKPWFAVDKRTTGTGAGAIYAVAAEFFEGQSPFGDGGSPIRFAASFDHGNNWILLPTPVSATNLCTVT
jgi:hypothetical protein